MVLARMSGDALNFLRQRSSPISATGAAPTSSSPVMNSLPRTGFTPRLGKKSEETRSPFTCSASPAPMRLKEKTRESAMEEKERFPFCQSRKFGYEIEPFSKLALFSPNATNCSDCGKGSGFSSTPFTIENTAVFAPIPSASVMTATVVKAGDFNAIRTPYRRSWNRVSIFLVPHELNSHSAPQNSTQIANILVRDRLSFLVVIELGYSDTVHSHW